jgi:hypothetical protein
MDKVSEEFEPFDIGGPEGETLFWGAIRGFRSGHGLQQEMDQTWAHYVGIEDHRLLALVAALCVEKSIDALMMAFAPGFSEYQNDSDFTFSTKIKVLRSMRFLPVRILTNCDLIRKMRNEFAHHLEYKEFARLDARKFRNKLMPYVQAFNKRERDEKDIKHLFVELVSFTLVALHIYTQHLDKLRRYLMTSDSRASFKKWVAENDTARKATHR